MKIQRGFTLIELAIVLVLLTVLAGGLLMPLTTQIETRRIAETQKTLEDARQAIMGYAMSSPATVTCTCKYQTDTTLDASSSTCSFCQPSGPADATLTFARHYLPCPDLSGADPEPNQDNDLVDGLTDLNNGVEDRYIVSVGGTTPGACATAAGNLPWVTLGTAAQDAWGNRIRYSLTASYGDKAKGFSSTSTGDNQVCISSAGGCSPTGTVARDVPVVLVSHGPNGWGARNVNGTMQTAPSSADELENTDADTGFVSRAPTQAGSASGEFDDLVEWISHDLLTSRVCPSGGCP